MRRIIVVYGLIAGSIISVLMLFSMFLWTKDVINFDNGEYFGYGSMLVALSMVFFGIKSYRDNQNDRSIGFGKGVQIGLLISLLASLMYAVSWEVYYQKNARIHEIISLTGTRNITLAGSRKTVRPPTILTVQK